MWAQVEMLRERAAAWKADPRWETATRAAQAGAKVGWPVVMFALSIWGMENLDYFADALTPPATLDSLFSVFEAVAGSHASGLTAVLRAMWQLTSREGAGDDAVSASCALVPYLASLAKHALSPRGILQLSPETLCALLGCLGNLSACPRGWGQVLESGVAEVLLASVVGGTAVRQMDGCLVVSPLVNLAAHAEGAARLLELGAPGVVLEALERQDVRPDTKRMLVGLVERVFRTLKEAGSPDTCDISLLDAVETVSRWHKTDVEE
eukprot:m51a1_g5676 hypothetical protein (266) ;mRNA; r:963409-964676